MRQRHGAANEPRLCDRIRNRPAERQVRGAGGITRDLHVTPAHGIGPARAERLERRLPGREPRGQVHPRAMLAPAVRQLSLAERVGEEVVATVEARPEGRDVDEIDADPHRALVRTTPPGPPGRGGPSRASGRYRGSSAGSGPSPPPWAAR